ncbi:hypothetical protein AWJ20_2634 [Sugiyamaella lignohabitans]|uniref:DUF3835 domain-containing protein n=1 Tax=Sugiyamaella lignohabitans TaxID=796027 RepID=A0A167F9Z2_9ASCO|nr:uncharacterized protein AWJ20_2634 [Sugiyamaella lignohabitans]ANB15014.1 hypothetical protein AWJ20_2634 [Sugiyamaella lignohabitans]
MTSLTVNFNHGIEVMQTRFASLQKRYSQYLDLSLKIKTSPDKFTARSKDGSHITVELGDSYFADLTVQETLDFLDRRIAVIEDDMRIELERLALARKAVKDVERLATGTEQSVLVQSINTEKSGNSTPVARNTAEVKTKEETKSSQSHEKLSKSKGILKTDNSVKPTIATTSTHSSSSSSSSAKAAPAPSITSSSTPITQNKNVPLAPSTVQSATPASSTSSNSSIASADSSDPYQIDDSEFFTSEGLPMMDIREELDEDGNVISSSVEPQNKNHELRAFAQDHLSRIIQQREDELSRLTEKDNITNGDRIVELDNSSHAASAEKPVYGPERPPANTPKVFGTIVKNSGSSSGSSTKSNSTTAKLKKEEATKIVKPKTESIVQASTSDSSPEKKANASHGSEPEVLSESQDTREIAEHVDTAGSENSSTNLIHPEHMLELELIADQLNDEEDYSGDEQYEEDEEGEEEEEDDDDDEDEDEYGRTRGSLFPFAKPPAEASGQTDKKKVNFSPNLEIKTYNIGERINQPDNDGWEDEEEEPVAKEKVSRFKAGRSSLKGKGKLKLTKGYEDATVISSNAVRPVSDVTERPVSDIVERPVSDIAERPVSDIVERPVSDIVERPVSQIVERPVSDIAERPVSDIAERPVSDIVERPVSDIVERPVSDIVERPVSHIVERPVERPVTQEVSKPKVNIGPSVANRRIFQQPVIKRGPQKAVPMNPRAGLSLPEEEDDTPETSGLATTPANRPFRDDIYDLAAEHFDKALIPDEDFLALHDREGFDDVDDSDDSQAEENVERPILSTSVYERDQDENEADDDLDDEDYDQKISRREIAEEYQRLRQKLIGSSGGFKKTDQEQIFEPLNEDGTEVKVSRFKAARLANRYLPTE